MPIVSVEEINSLVAQVEGLRQTQHSLCSGSSLTDSGYEGQPSRRSADTPVREPKTRFWRLPEDCLISEASDNTRSSGYDGHSTTSSEPTAMTVPSIPSDDERPTEHRIRCEFWKYTGCQETFDMVSTFVDHCFDHHPRPLPETSVCWFCDTYIWKAPSDNLRAPYYFHRLWHIGEHYRHEAPGRIRPDHFVLDHLYRSKEISPGLYKELYGHESMRVKRLLEGSSAHNAPGEQKYEEEIAGRRGRGRREARERRRY